MFTVTEKYPTNDPGKYTLTMSATVIKDGKYDAGQNVAVGVVTNAGTNYLTTTSVNGATVAQFGASNIIKPESLLKADAPAVYQIMFTSGADKVVVTIAQSMVNICELVRLPPVVLPLGVC